MAPEQLVDLWDQSRTGDVSAYQSLHKSLYPQLYSYVQNMFWDEDHTNDLLQDLFVKLWQKRQAIGSLVHVKAYFYRSARCMALNKLRDDKNEVEKNAVFQRQINVFVSSREEAIAAKEQDRELSKALADALNQLPSRRREIIFLKFYDQLEYDQIVEITGIQYQSVINHVHRAISSLRSVLMQTGPLKTFSDSNVF